MIYKSSAKNKNEDTRSTEIYDLYFNMIHKFHASCVFDIFVFILFQNLYDI